MTLRVGDQLPDIELVDHAGQPWRTFEQRGHPLVRILHRHLACLSCQEDVIAVRDRLNQFGDATIVVVTFAALD